MFKNGTIVDVKAKTSYRADLAVSGGVIAEIGRLDGEREVDCSGKVLCPGFIDAHVHIESSMASPAAFAEAVLPHGTTTVIADPHEMVNVRGNEAMKYLLDVSEDLPVSVYVMLPSSIPSTPFETNGADFTSKDMEAWIEHPRVLGLGEVMCYPDVLAGRKDIMDKIALCRGKVIDGHAPGLSGTDLHRYIQAGVMTDHECTSFEEAEEKRRAGMKILIREGSAARNVEAIVSGIVKKGLDTEGFLFCTDDKHLDTTRYLKEEVAAENGLFCPDSTYSKLCVFERHRGTGNIKAAPLKGYGITNGAVATSVAHDSHNIIAAGDNDRDIMKAVEMIQEMQGGYALVQDGKDVGRLPLPIAGLMSTQPAKEIQRRLDAMVQRAREMGVSEDCDPFTTLSFMALPVIPELRLTDKGLVDVKNFQMIKEKGE